MIRTVRVEYMRRHGTPGMLIAVADKYGRIIYETKKAPPTRRGYKRRAGNTTKP